MYIYPCFPTVGILITTVLWLGSPCERRFSFFHSPHIHPDYGFTPLPHRVGRSLAETEGKAPGLKKSQTQR